MSEKEHYSDFLLQLSGLTSELTLFSGFTLTLLTLLVTTLPNPNTFQSQISLLFLTIIFDLLVSLLHWVSIMRTLFCRYLPFKEIRGSRYFNPLLFIVYSLWGLSTTIIFILFSLTNLALASISIWGILVIIGYAFYWQQFKEYYNKHTS
jgi:hypothetical protein